MEKRLQISSRFFRKHLPNILTFSRIPLIFMTVIFGLMGLAVPSFRSFYIAIISLILASVTDFLDGKVARMYNSSTQLGGYADQLTDKIWNVVLFPSLILGIAFKGDKVHATFVFILIISLLARDQWVTFLRKCADLEKQDISPLYIGKVRTFVQFVWGCIFFPYAFLPAGFISAQGGIMHGFVKFFVTLPVEVFYFLEASIFLLNLISLIEYTKHYSEPLLEQLTEGDYETRNIYLSCVPNTITSLSIASSMIGIAFAAQGYFGVFLGCILFAVVCDGMDGKIARKLGVASSGSGVILDDIADFFSFVFAPAIAFIFKDNGPDLLTYSLALLYITCGIMRLAYFTLSTKAIEDLEKIDHKNFILNWMISLLRKCPNIPGYFGGIPTTNAGLMITGAMFSNLIEIPFFLPALVLISSILMVSFKIPYIHIGRTISGIQLKTLTFFSFTILIFFTRYFGDYTIFCCLVYYISPLIAKIFIKPGEEKQEEMIKKEIQGEETKED